MSRTGLLKSADEHFLVTEIEELAKYVHCIAHNLNLGINNAVRNIVEVSTIQFCRICIFTLLVVSTDSVLLKANLMSHNKGQ